MLPSVLLDCSRNKYVGIVIGSVGCLISIGVFTDDENDLSNSCLRLFCLVGVDGDTLRFRWSINDSFGEFFAWIKSDNDNVCGF